MMLELKRYKASDDKQSILTALLQDGGVIVEELINTEQLAQINGQIDELMGLAHCSVDNLNPLLKEFFGKQTRHITGLGGKSTAFTEHVMLNPLFLHLCDEVLLPNCADYQLNLAHVMDRGPGATVQFFHRDEDIWVHCPTPRPELELASIIALVDFSKENGATCVAPGSHRWSDRHRQPSDDEVAYAEMPAGSAVIYLGSTVHAGGTNTTADQWRRGVHMSYALGWLRTEENNVLSVPPAIAKTLPKRAQELMGYGIHDAIEDAGGYLGMVEMNNPVELLNQGKLPGDSGTES